MPKEKAQFEAFFKGEPSRKTAEKRGIDLDKIRQERREKEQEEKLRKEELEKKEQELREKALLLAEDTEQAFAKNDFDKVLENLRELQSMFPNPKEKRENMEGRDPKEFLEKFYTFLEKGAWGTARKNHNWILSSLHGKKQFVDLAIGYGGIPVELFDQEVETLSIVSSEKKEGRGFENLLNELKESRILSIYVKNMSGLYLKIIEP